jgi:hypothetical protein
MSWSNKSLQQARVRSMKLADVCTKAFGMPLNDPAYPGGARICCRPALAIQEANR